jgi:hypothetical protein
VQIGAGCPGGDFRSGPAAPIPASGGLGYWKAGIGDTRQAFHAQEVGKRPKTGVKNDKRVMSAV